MRISSSLVVLAALPAGIWAGDIIKTDGFSSCLKDASVKVTNMNIQYDRSTGLLDFDVSGISEKRQNVTGYLSVTAYGNTVYQKEFNPCDSSTYYKGLCPVPKGTFGSKGTQKVPPQFASMIPSIAFSVPDLAGEAKLQLNTLKGNHSVACIESPVGNGQTMKNAAVSYAAAGILGASLALSGLAAIGAAGQPGVATSSPTFGEVFGWFHGMAMNGMLSVQYPQVYQSFSENFGFATGLVSWRSMQTSIDNFRASTGGNLFHDNIDYIENATLINTDSASASGLSRRSMEILDLFVRDQIQTHESGSTNDNGTSNESGPSHFVHGIQSYVEALTIPQANTFMTVLLVFAIVIAAITVGILLFKVVLETWALFGTFPKKLTSFRKRYWWVMAKTITNLILLLYGIWTLYCVYQFVNGDSWAAKALAGVTLGLFTAVLALFTFRIWQIARKYKHAEGDASALFEDKETWRKYSLFYENYKKSYWWLFVPAIVYMFAKGCVIAGADGHGLIQTGGQLIVESLLLILLLWSRPYTLKSGNWINIIIQVVRVLSVCCILVFVEELGVAQSTQTITGVILIVMQSALTGILGILIAVNAFINFCRLNPHRKKRKEAEKMQRDLDNLTPLDARNSLLMDPTDYKGARGSFVSAHPLSASRGYNPVPATDDGFTRSYHQHNVSDTEQGLLHSAAGMGHRHERSMSPPASRAPRLPDLGTGEPYGRAF